MKFSIGVLIAVAAFATIFVFTEAKPPMPPDMPADLQKEFDAIAAEMQNVPKDDTGRPDFKQISPELRARMEKLRTDYETQTGNKWPMPPGPPPPQ
uniref:CSON013141 protein n=1 Tax=Culicoides sonorensis TaxID=179676 RepID=A0A336M765_CULSO